MTGNFQSTQRKDFSVNICFLKYLSVNIKSLCVFKFDIFNFFQISEAAFTFCCKASTFSLYFDILYAFFTNMGSSVYLLSHAAPKHGFKS